VGVAAAAEVFNRTCYDCISYSLYLDDLSVFNQSIVPKVYISLCGSEDCLLLQMRGRQRTILAYKISRFLFDFPVISLKNNICCKSGWGWRFGLISELDFKEICFGFS